MSINRKSVFGSIKSFCVALAILAWVLSVSLAYAKHEGVPPRIIVESILVNGQIPATLCDLPLSSSTVLVHFEGEGSAPPGRVNQYFVQVGWGDGTFQLLSRDSIPAEIVFDPDNGKHVDFDFVADVSHTYPDVEASYFMNIKLFHSEPGGQDSPADAEVDVQICIRAPLDPTLNADLTLVNGEAPVFSCPFEPISRPAVITVEGGGEFTPLAGDTTGWEVEIDWADGTVDTFSEFTTNDGIDFMFTIEKLHEYLVDLGNGPHQIRIALLENGLSVATALPIDICVFTPVDTTLQIDLLSGDHPPENSTCPVSTFLGPVTIEGGGEFSAPQGSEGLFRVEIDWADGTPVETIFPAVEPLVLPVPDMGVPANFMYDYLVPHGYMEEGTYVVALRLLDAENVEIDATSVEVVVCAPRGTFTGTVTDLESGEPIIGAVVIQDITDDPPTPGSFASLNIYALQTLPGFRTILVFAEGWVPAVVSDFEVFADGDPAVPPDDVRRILDFELVREETSMNVVNITFPVGPKPQGNQAQMHLHPQCVEAVNADGEVEAIICVHAGDTYTFIGLPDGDFTFRGLSPFYIIDQEEKKLNNDEHDPGDDAPNMEDDVNIQLHANVPEGAGPAAASRASFVTGGVSGITTDGTTPVGVAVYGTFIFEGLDVTVTIDSNVDTGAFLLDLLPGGETVDVVSYTGSNRSLTVATDIVGGEVHSVGFPLPTDDLTLAPFDAATDNFVPQMQGPLVFDMLEDIALPFTKDDFDVIDFDHIFSVEHSLSIQPGFHYTVNGTELIPELDYHGVLVVPVTISDEFNTSAPFVLTVIVASILDDPVFVDFDSGQPFSEGGTGGVGFPLLTLSEALSEVAADGTVMISGGRSQEPPLTIDQSVTLQNDNAMGEVVSLDPKLTGPPAITDSAAKTGFVSRTADSE